MEELGTILRESRQARGLTIDDVAQVTRIRPRYLEALEGERYDVLPTPVHVRGFLRNYALYLKLDPDPLIARYNASRSVVKDIPLEKLVRPELDKPAPPPPETLDDEVGSEPVFYRPAGISLRAPAWFSRDLLVGIFALAVLIFFVFWVGSRFILPVLDRARATETPVAESETVTVTAAGAAEAGASSATPSIPSATLTPTSPPIFSSVQLQIEILERNWLSVVVDGETVQEGMVQPGDLFAWDAVDQVKLRTGNGAGVSVTLNGQDLGPLGGRGEVVERIWGLSGEIAPTPMPTATVTEPPVEAPEELPAASPTPGEG
jgi:transcriptional regulator with XRE-family HTH domain